MFLNSAILFRNSEFLFRIFELLRLNFVYKGNKYFVKIFLGIIYP